MNRCVLTLLLYLLTVPATAGDLPFMRLFSPDPQTTKYSQSSNILVAGRVAPFIESGVRIDLYEVRDNGRLFRLVGTEINMDSRGVFSSSLLPPAKGWPIGNIRVVATLCDLAQVKQSTTIEVAKRKDIPEEGIETKQLEHSDIIVDTEQSNGPYQVIGGHTFLIRGRFVQEGGLKGNQGPKVRATIVLPAAAGKNPEFGQQDVAAISLPDNEPDHFWYEILIDAPSKPDSYKLRIDQDWPHQGEPKAPAKQPKDGFDLQVGLGPAKKPDNK